MKYEVYTDGACSHDKNKIASAFIIRTRDNFIDQKAVCFEDNNIAIAETLAVGIAVDYLLTNCNLVRGKDSVAIRTDSQSVIEFFKNVKEPGSVPKSADKRVIITWNSLKKLTETCEWSFHKIVAHTNEINGNKVADRLAKYVLRLNCER